MIAIVSQELSAYLKAALLALGSMLAQFHLAKGEMYFRLLTHQNSCSNVPKLSWTLVTSVSAVLQRCWRVRPLAHQVQDVKGLGCLV